ncbi:MAG: hypothetical protein NUV67_00595 [archaeon]|nr:hypothetical protein [archaeon]
MRTEIREMLVHLGGPAKACQLLGVSYVALKEWPHGRKPISLEKLDKLIGFCTAPFQDEIKSKIDSREVLLSCRYSPHKIKFPKIITPDLAYLLGLFLGDGTFAGDSSNERGNWTIGVFFDNRNHQALYDSILLEIFGIKAKHYDSKKNCFVSYFASKALHWFLRSYFEVCNGYKANKIIAPSLIFVSNNWELVAPFLQGLFDSDGTITKKREVKYATTSKRMSGQVKELLDGHDFKTGLDVWLKNERFLPLYTVRLRGKDSVKKFAEEINFRHCIKKARCLETLS